MVTKGFVRATSRSRRRSVDRLDLDRLYSKQGENCWEGGSCAMSSPEEGDESNEQTPGAAMEGVKF